MSTSRFVGLSLALFLALSAPALALSPDEINTAPFVADPATPSAASPSDATKEQSAKSKSGKAGKDKSARKRDKQKPKGPQGLIVKVQVLLARKSISPGEIDGRDGETTARPSRSSAARTIWARATGWTRPPGRRWAARPPRTS
ncbi:hypothetical protein [Azorhizobium sp. AG788]|uniref:hypothetical protein n=1 Tax=Azorhizobium sp. AG788 TaxID=2183897 RepID=UPI00105CD269|nr:hypothetical protein [Azorhizobium sp. AG788]